MDIEIGYAESPEELQAVFRLRYEIYHQEMHIESTAVDHENRILKDAHDDTALILYARVDGDIAGTVRLHWGGRAPFATEHVKTYDLERFLAVAAPEQMVIFSRLMVRKQYRGTMLPLQLFGAIATYSLEKRVRLSFCDCQPHLLNLYTRLGYRTYTKTYNDAWFGLLVPLVLVIEDLAHFERINSPLLAFAGRGFQPAVPDDLLALLPQEPVIQPITEAATAHWAQSYDLLADSHERTSSILAGLGEEEIARLMKQSFLIQCEKNDLIIRKHSVDRTMFIVLSGQVEVREGERVVAVLTRGDVVGELAFLAHAERLSDVYAATDDVRIMSLNEKVILGLIDQEPAIAARLFYNLARVVGTRMVSRYQWTAAHT